MLPGCALTGVLGAVLLLAPACNSRPAAKSDSNTQPVPEQSTAPKRVREPAVAGLFYPKEPDALLQTLDNLLGSAPALPRTNGELKALICPHAGYRYSGLTAAFGYKQLVGHEFDTVVILAPSHYAMFSGASLASADAYRTPAGLVPVSAKAKEWVKDKPFILEARCLVQRPQWWSQASKTAPPQGEDTPDTWEHAAEVQVPFLQKALKKFSILPVTLGEVNPADLGRVLATKIDEKTLVVASSDLSHYHPYQQARELDNGCLQAILNLNLEELAKQEACGKQPIMALVYLAKQKGWSPRLLDYRNSGDTSGDKSAVVGYTAIAFYAPEAEAYSRSERKQLVQLARTTLQEVVRNGSIPKADVSAFPKKFNQPKGCFVTLTIGGTLRGCIGHIMPQEALYKAVMDNARSAALRDPRFPPVQPDELNKIEIEVSVLTEPRPLVFKTPEELLSKLEPHKDGVVLKLGAYGATYLPQVWSQLPEKVNFLNSLAEKAGCAPSEWRKPGAAVSIYRVEAFKESEFSEAPLLKP